MFKLHINLNADYFRRTAVGLKESLQRRILRRALEAGSQPLVKQLRQEVRAHKTYDSTGVLGRSIGVAARTNSRGETSVRVGALRLKTQEVSVKQQRNGKRYFVMRRGSRYFHLADKNRDGAARVKRIFAARKHEAAALIANKFEELVDREVEKNVFL